MINDGPGKNVILAGATGTIGQAVAKALVARNHRVICLVRPGSDCSSLPSHATIIEFDVADIKNQLVVDKEATFISCLASRTGVKSDAWAIDYQANKNFLALAENAGAAHFLVLSAICVQRPKLAFQHAKLAFEAELQKGSIRSTIVRPTAFFKSLSGQVDRVKNGKAFLVFGDGELTRCKPISDRDLANFIVDQIEDPNTQHRILPIGGPGSAISPLDQAAMLFEAALLKSKIRHVPLWFMVAIREALGLAAKLFPSLEEKAEYARIGYYYATESMLVFDTAKGVYDADATPSYGSDTLKKHYEKAFNASN